MTSPVKKLGMDLKSKRERKKEDYGYHLDYRLRWNDNDMFTHVNNPVYGVLIDSIVNTFMIKHCNYKVNRHPQAAIIANTYCDYFGSLSYPDTVECGMRVVKLGKASVTYEVGLFKQGDPVVKAVGGSTHVFVRQDVQSGGLGRVDPGGMPGEFRRGFEKLLEGGEGVWDERIESEKVSSKL